MEWRKALQDFEETPPSHCWTEIKESLEQDIPELRNQLYHYAEPAPEGTMQEIFAKLEKKERQNIFFFSRSRAVAAASVAVLLTLSILYIIGSPDKSPNVGAAVIQSKKNTQSNYIVHTNQNGEQVNISPKLRFLISSSQNPNDSLVKKWQHKLAHSPYMPAGNNFFDIAEMVHLLEEKEKP